MKATDSMYPVPPGWRLCSVDEIKAPEPSSCVAGPFGSEISSKYFVDEGVPVIRGSNLCDDLTRFVPDGFAFVSEERSAQYRPQHVKAGDLVFTCWGTIGQVGLIPQDGPYTSYIISNKQLKLRVDRTIADPAFCFYYLASPAGVEYIRNRGIGGAVPGINLGILKKLPIALPPLETQQRIVDTLSAYDDLVENNRRRMTLLEESARLLYQEWFVRLRFPGHERTQILDGLPRGWEKKSLGKVADLNCSTLPNSFDGEVLYVDIASVIPGQITDMTSYTIREAPSRARRRVHHGDTIWSCVRPNRRSHALIWDPPENMIVSTGFAVITPISVSSTFMYLAVTSDSFVGYLQNHARGAAYPAVVASDFERAEILIPSQSLLSHFQEICEPIFAQLHRLIRQNQKLKAARDLLLPRLMSGEIAIRSSCLGLPLLKFSAEI